MKNIARRGGDEREIPPLQQVEYIICILFLRVTSKSFCALQTSCDVCNNVI